MAEAIVYGKIGDEPLGKVWEDIYEPTAFMVGFADDNTPGDFGKAMYKLLGEPVDAQKLIPEESQLPPLEIGAASIPLGFLIAVGFALGLWLIVRQTTTGYEIAILGSSPRTATYAGIPARRLTIAVLLLGGALAGLAGTLQMSGEVHRYGDALSNNSGYTGIIIAVLAGGSELGVIVIALVFAVLTISGTIFRVAGASSDLIFAMYGVTLIFAAIGQGLAYVRLARRPVELSKSRRGGLGEAGATDAEGSHGA
jgi:simple sugar transport system permease protein